MEKDALLSNSGGSFFGHGMGLIFFVSPVFSLLVGSDYFVLERINYVVLLVFLAFALSLGLTYYNFTRASTKCSYYYVSRHGKITISFWDRLLWVCCLVSVLLLAFFSVLAYVNAVASDFP